MNNVISKLQSRIDRRSTCITALEHFLLDPDTEWLADNLEQERTDQVLDKRLMGEIIKLTRERNEAQFRAWMMKGE